MRQKEGQESSMYFTHNQELGRKVKGKTDQSTFHEPGTIGFISSSVTPANGCHCSHLSAEEAKTREVK